ncbi:Methylamine utilisation protein MauE [Nocardioides exalbidus]|uniref:Methylamine utilisation protein MauE n=1 Tax=Nocardioides exalbidus TaxID=402596 RepID=A0A1H4LAB3_9ACTN|nr:MauE/DoxX family redox-associated membrane protein [Nocardioides exalbidus]SEB67255.1 Methylamine utilisation protein MauE [Nocardioides exalbidus]
MSSAPVAALVAVLTLAAVLATSGVAKLRDRVATRDAFAALRVPDVVPAGPASAALPWAELALAALLLVAPSRALVAVTALVLVLMLAYTALIGRALTFDEPVTCSCFGSLSRHDVDRTTLLRNVLLSLLAGAALWFAVDGGSVLSVVRDLDAAGWWAIVAAIAAAAVAALVVGTGSAPRAAETDELLDYERDRTPYGVVRRADGSVANLWDLTSTQARLLVVLKPGCGPCVRTAEKLDGLAAQLSPAVGVLAVYPDETAASSVTEHARDLAVSEPDGNIRRGFSVGTPAAVLLGADGFLAGGPVAGERDVTEFFAEVVEALREQPET